MKKVALGRLVLTMALALATPAIATPITGSVAIVGFDTYSATGISFHVPSLVGSASGSLAIMQSYPVVTLGNIASFSNATGHVLFDWNHGGTDITLTIHTLTVMQNTSTFLNVFGTAEITETGLSPTPYDFSLTSTRAGLTTFTVDAAPAASPVPEPGSLLLVGGGLLGLAGLLFRKARKQVSTLPC
jgi:PEP-CTERM motif